MNIRAEVVLPPLTDSYIVAVLQVLLRLLWRLFSLSVLLAGLLILTVYVSFVYVEHYHQQVQAWFSQALQQSVEIQAMRGEWEDGSPVLHIGNSRLGETAEGAALAGFTRAQIRVDLIASLLQRQLITQDIYVENAYFTLQQHAEQGVHLLGLPTVDAPVKQAANADYGILLHWFLQQSSIQLKRAQFIWQAEQQSPVRFSQMDLALIRQSEQDYVLQGALQLPTQAYTPPLAAGLGLSSQGGQVQFRLQTQWREQRLHEVKGALQINDLQLASAHAELVLPAVATEIHWQPLMPQGWQMQLNNFSFATLEDTWPASHISLLAVPDPNSSIHGIELQGKIGFLRLHELVPLLSGLSLLPAHLRTALSATKPQAELHSTHFRLRADDWELRTHFRQASNQPWQQLPGLRNFAGVLNLRPSVGSLTLNSQAVQVLAPHWLADRLQLDNLHGTLTWQRQTDAAQAPWVLHSSDLQLQNADVENISVRGKVVIPTNGDAPNADLDIQAQHIVANRLKHYVPINVPHTRRWMQNGLLDGAIEHAEIRLRGSLERSHLLLQSQGQSGLQGDLRVRNAKIQYASGWPVLENVQGNIRIDGDTLLIDGKQGQVMQHQLYDTQVELRDLDTPKSYISIQGHTKGDAADALGFIANSPLSHTVDVSKLQITGAVAIDLNMHIPLSSDKERTQGTVHFSDSYLSHAMLDEIDLPLQHLQGELAFTSETLSAEHLQAELLEQPVRLKLQRLPNDNAPNAQKSVQIDVNGSANQHFLQQLFSRVVPELAPWTRQFSGTTQWQARLLLPDAAEQAGHLHVTSNLHGAALDLPQPFGKSMRDSRELVFETPLDQQPLGRLRYAEHLNLAYQGDALALYFGNRAAELKPQAGWQLSGYLPEIAINEWKNWFCKVKACNPSPEELNKQTVKDQPFALLRQQLHGKTLLLDVSSDQLRWHDSVLHQLQLQGFANAQRGLLQFNSTETQGKLDYTQSPAQVNLLLSRLHLPDSDKPSDTATVLTPQDYLNTMQHLTQQSTPADPRYLPPLAFYCESLKLGDSELGSLEIQAEPSPQGFALKSLSLNNPHFNAQASGLWAYRKQSSLSSHPDMQTTQLDAQLYADNFAQAVAQFGQSESAIQGGQTQLHFQGNWPGNPLQFHQAYLKGKLHINIAKGQIEAVELGPAGRLVGLLDFNSLSHRLSLDFRDVFEKGFGFNKIEGEFFLEGGHAYTDGISLKGPIADIEIAGRTGLLNRTYEQDVIVMPHLSNTLPVAGAVAGGPAVGVAVLVLQGLLKNDLKEAVKYHYRITGHWDNPQIVLLNEQTAEE